MNKKNILFISPFYPDNEESPRHRAVFNHVQYFIKKKYNITFVYLSNKDIELDIDLKFIRLDLPSFFSIVKNIFFHLLFLRNMSLQNCLFYSDTILQKLKKLNLSKKYDIIFCESVRTAPYYKVSDSAFKIIDLGDLISRRYKLLRNSKIKVNNVLGQFNDGSSWINRLLKIYSIQKTVLFIEEKLVKRIEEKCTNYFDSIILVSKYEQSLLNHHSKKKNVYWIPNIDLNQINNNPKFSQNKIHL